MRERHWRACRSEIVLFHNNDVYRCPVIEHVTRPPAPNCSKKYGPGIKDAENHTTPLVLAILDQLPNEQETALRTNVETRNHGEAVPAQFEAFIDSTRGCFAWSSGQLNEADPMLLPHGEHLC
ncbi:hypothetical protein TNCV_3696281 [Trichonephila clavipes]|nr:hypothetical protein TNCV_3696281 [Trichonephila clavipes]